MEHDQHRTTPSDPPVPTKILKEWAALEADSCRNHFKPFNLGEGWKYITKHYTKDEIGYSLGETSEGCVFLLSLELWNRVGLDQKSFLNLFNAHYPDSDEYVSSLRDDYGPYTVIPEVIRVDLIYLDLGSINAHDFRPDYIFHVSDALAASGKPINGVEGE